VSLGWAAAVLALALAAGACRGDRGGTRDGQAAAPPAASSTSPSAAGAAADAAPPAAPAPMSPTDSALAAQEDSMHEADLFHRRQASMESEASCMAKARVADPPQRAILEAACKRSHGTQPASAQP
jgi:hypothetical protein